MTAATAHGIERPALKVSVKLEDDTEYEIKMTYGLFNDLQRATPDPMTVLDTVTADPYTRDYIIRRCMTPTKKMVTEPDKELKPVDEIGLDDPDEIDKLLQWVVGHMLYFFATSAGGLKRLGEAFKGTLTEASDQPAPSTSGSEN
jgi:hypothetical protein